MGYLQEESDLNKTIKISARRFEESPYIERTYSPKMVRGVYAGRYFPISIGEDPIEKYWLLRQKALIFDVPEKPIEIFSKTVANFNYDDCPGHPVWLEPCEWLGKVNKKYPLHLISNQPKNKLHSQMDHGKYSKSFKINEREPLEINPLDANKRNLKNGDVVRMFNDRGSCLAGIKITEEVMQGVVQMSTGAWYDPENPTQDGSMCKHGNPNVLTPDKGTSKLGQGPIAHSCLIEIEKYNDKIPKLTAFDPPTIIRSNAKTN